MTPVRETYRRHLEGLLRIVVADPTEANIRHAARRLAVSYENALLSGVDAAEEWAPIAEFETREAIRRARR